MRHRARLAGLGDRLLDEPAHVGVAREVRLDERLGLPSLDAEVLGEREGALPVEKGVVDHLRDAPLVVRAHRRERAEDLARGAVVDVLALHERVDERRVLREVGEDAQLDLAVVGGEEEAPRLGHERLADAPALRGADRDVLQVRVGRRRAGRSRRRSG